MDNRIFNVNGSSEKMLQKTLDLVFAQEGDNTTCKAWKATKEHGLILLWSDSPKGCTPFPAPMSAIECAPIVSQWLKGDFAKSVDLSDFCEDMDHDGSNSDGWQVYCENWGHVGDEHQAICAIKPAFMWHGKQV